MDCEDCNSGKCTCGHEFGIHSSSCAMFPTSEADNAMGDGELMTPKITNPEQLEVGKLYWLEYKKFSLKTELVCCEEHPEGGKYFGPHKIWATKDNPQAFDRWNIYGPITPPAFNDRNEPLFTRQQVIDELMAHEDIRVHIKQGDKESGIWWSSLKATKAQVIALLDEGS